MATQKMVSPGVFTREIDQSFLAQGVRGIGAAIIGRAPKGPAFLPVFLEGYDGFVSMFGDIDPNMQAVYASKNYLRNSTALNFLRVLGHTDGSTATNGYVVSGVSGIAETGSNGNILAIVHHTGSAGTHVLASQVAGSTTDFVFTVTNPNGGATMFAATASFLSSSANYVKKVLNVDPTKYSTYGHYLYSVFSYDVPQLAMTASVIAISGGFRSFERDFEGGNTQWVTSQPIGNSFSNLFRFSTLGHGKATNDELKVMISNVKPSPSPLATPYGSFDVIVRAFGDTDQRPQILEQFTGCTLDKTSPSYVVYRIGDQYEQFNTATRKFDKFGDYENKSNLIRVEMDTTVTPSAEALPWGHRGYKKLLWVSASTIQEMPYTINQTDRNGNLDTNITWGISYVSGGIDARMKAFPNAVGSLTGSDSDFNMSFLTSSYDSNSRQVWAYNSSLVNTQWHQPVYLSSSLYKFSLPFIGGFDGWDLRVSDPLYLSNAADTSDVGVTSLIRALDCLANPDYIDINLLAIPGVHNLKVTDRARLIANERADLLYIMDITGSTVAQAYGGIQNREIDDNYVACYYPDLKIKDNTNRRIVRVSPSVGIMGAIAYNDRVGQVFFAPAGMVRGGLGQFDIVDVIDRLTYQDRSDLYDNRVNPIAVFPQEGINVFGQKTMQIKPSALDRINVRRLLIYAKKTIASAAKFLVFEPNNAATWQRFVQLVNPILAKIQQDRGIERFKVVMDTSTNTPDVIDRNTMVGKIFLQPTKAAEFIDISFIITNAGVAFGD